MSDRIQDFLDRTDAKRRPRITEIPTGSDPEQGPPRQEPPAAAPSDEDDPVSRFLAKTNQRRRHAATVHDM